VVSWHLQRTSWYAAMSFGLQTPRHQRMQPASFIRSTTHARQPELPQGHPSPSAERASKENRLVRRHADVPSPPWRPLPAAEQHITAIGKDFLHAVRKQIDQKGIPGRKIIRFLIV
jgi:hypothetical protein